MSHKRPPHFSCTQEHDVVRAELQPLAGLGTWRALLPARLEAEFAKRPRLAKGWKSIKKRRGKLSAEEQVGCARRTERQRQNIMAADAKEAIAQRQSRRAWLNRPFTPSHQADLEEKDLYIWNLIQRFFTVLDSISDNDKTSDDTINYCSRFLELMVDIEVRHRKGERRCGPISRAASRVSLAPPLFLFLFPSTPLPPHVTLHNLPAQALLTTRRYLNTVIDASGLVTHCRMSDLAVMARGHLFAKLLDMLQFYVRFEIDDYSGEPLTDDDMTKQHYSAILSLQQLAFKHFEELRDFALSNVSGVDTFEVRRRRRPASLRSVVCALLCALCCVFGLFSPFPSFLFLSFSHFPFFATSPSVFPNPLPPLQPPC